MICPNCKTISAENAYECENCGWEFGFSSHSDESERVISVLCAARKSEYENIPGLDVWTASRNAYNYTGRNPVIAHAPCQQWSRLKAFAKVNEVEKNLAWFCFWKVQVNGGIFEHPHGSSFFDTVGVKPTLCIDQSWFGFPARKRTWLYFSKCKPLAYPLSFDAVARSVPQLGKEARSKTTLHLARWLVELCPCDFRRGYITPTAMKLKKGLYLHFYVSKKIEFVWWRPRLWNMPDYLIIRFFWFQIIVTELPF